MNQKTSKKQQASKLKADLKEALTEVALLKQGKGNKETLKSFLDRL